MSDDAEQEQVARSRERRRHRRQDRSAAFDREQRRALETINPRMFGHTAFVRWTQSLQRPGGRRSAVVLVAAALLVVASLLMVLRAL